MFNRKTISVFDTRTSFRAKRWPFQWRVVGTACGLKREKTTKKETDRDRARDTEREREDVKMRRWEDVKMWKCEDLKMRRWWRCEDVKVWRCEDENVWRCEHMKVYSRPPLLEEPFAQTLSGKIASTNHFIPLHIALVKDEFRKPETCCSYGKNWYSFESVAQIFGRGSISNVLQWMYSLIHHEDLTPIALLQNLQSLMDGCNLSTLSKQINLLTDVDKACNA